MSMVTPAQTAETWDSKQGKFQYGPRVRPARPAPHKSKQSADRSLKITASVATLGALGMLALYRRQRKSPRPALAPELTTSLEEVVSLRLARYAVQREEQSAAHLVTRVVEQESTERKNLQEQLDQIQARLRETQERVTRDENQNLISLESEIRELAVRLHEETQKTKEALRRLEEADKDHMGALQAAEARYTELQARAEQEAANATTRIKACEEAAAEASGRLQAAQQSLLEEQAHLCEQRQSEAARQEEVAPVGAEATERSASEAEVRRLSEQEEAKLQTRLSSVSLHFAEAKKDVSEAKLAQAVAGEELEEYRRVLERLQKETAITSQRKTQVTELLRRFAAHANLGHVRNLPALLELIGEGSVAAVYAWKDAHANATASVEDAETSFLLLVIEALASSGAADASAVFSKLSSSLEELEAQRQNEQQRLGESIIASTEMRAHDKTLRESLQRIEVAYKETQNQQADSRAELTALLENTQKRAIKQDNTLRQLHVKLLAAEEALEFQTRQREKEVSQSRAETAQAQHELGLALAAHQHALAELRSAKFVQATTQRELASLQQVQRASELAREQHEERAVKIVEETQNVVQSMIAAARSAGQRGPAEETLHTALMAVTEGDSTNKQEAIMRLGANYEMLSRAMVGVLQALHHQEAASEQREKLALELAEIAASVSKIPSVTARLQKEGFDKNSLLTSSLAATSPQNLSTVKNLQTAVHEHVSARLKEDESMSSASSHTRQPSSSVSATAGASTCEPAPRTSTPSPTPVDANANFMTNLKNAVKTANNRIEMADSKEWLEKLNTVPPGSHSWWRTDWNVLHPRSS